MNKLKSRILLSMILILLIIIIINYFSKKEGYDNYITKTPGILPESESGPILDSYPHTGKKTVSNDNASEIWWHYPELKVGSYKQITNNIRYNYNPDIGNCTPAEFCGALYKDKHVKSNIVKPLGPVCDGPGARVGYNRTDYNLLPFSIDTNENILY